MAVSRRFENIAGSRVAFLEAAGSGVPSGASGMEDPVLLVHGLFTSCFLWRNLVGRHGGPRRLLAPDFEGFGDTHCASQFELGFERQTEFLGSFLLARTGLVPVTVVAHSHGAVPALMLAMQKPGLVRDLVLVSPVFPPDFPGPLARPFLWAARSRLSWEAFLRSGLARAHVERELRRAFLGRGPETDAAVEEFWRPFANSPTACTRLRRVFEGCDGRLVNTYARHLDHVRRPVKVIVGRLDRQVDGHAAAPPAARLAAAIPGATAHVVDGAGHFLPLEDPDLLLSMLS